MTEPFEPLDLIGSTKNGGDFAELGLTFSRPQATIMIYADKIVPTIVFAGGYDVEKDDESDDCNVVQGGTPNADGNAIYFVQKRCR